MKPQLYKGIEFIEVKSVPQKDRSEFSEWAAANMKLIKILMEEESLITNCVQYKDYVFWKNQVKSKTDKLGNVRLNEVED